MAADARASRDEPAAADRDGSAGGTGSLRGGPFHATIDLIPITERFVAWAESSDVPVDLRAEAYSMSLVAMERDAMRRELPADRLRLLGHSQHVGTRPAFWLAKAESAREAVVAAEQSRGILLSRLTGGLDPAMAPS